MSLSQRQFNHLTEMGISVWQRRTLENNETIQATSKQLTVTLEQLSEQPIFRDILTALTLSIGEVKHSDHYLDLGMFNWHFHDNDELSFNSNELVTPTLDKISQSPAMKRQLWLLLLPQL